MTIDTILRLLGGVLLLAANAFFVAAEFAMTRLRQYSRDEFEGDSGLERAWRMTEKLEIYLTGCQVGITTCSVSLGVVAEPAVTKLIQLLIGVASIGTFSSHGISIIISILLINIAHTIWGEQTPTYLGVERTKSVARYFASPLYWWTKISYPFIYVGDSVTKATLRLFGITMSRAWKEGSEEHSKGNLKGQIADMLKDKGLTEERQEEIIKALEMGEIPVRDIMIEREKIAYLSLARSLEKNLTTIRGTMQTRYPLVDDESLDDFKGVVYASELLGNIYRLQNDEITLSELSHKDMTVAPDLPVSKLIDAFQDNKEELALVTNEDGRVEGLVTLTDALEVIVGSAEDPTETKQ